MESFFGQLKNELIYASIIHGENENILKLEKKHPFLKTEKLKEKIESYAPELFLNNLLKKIIAISEKVDTSRIFKISDKDYKILSHIERALISLERTKTLNSSHNDAETYPISYHKKFI